MEDGNRVRPRRLPEGGRWGTVAGGRARRMGDVTPSIAGKTPTRRLAVPGRRLRSATCVDFSFAFHADILVPECGGARINAGGLFVKRRSRELSVDAPALVAEQDQVGPTADAEFCQEIRDVELDGALGNVEAVGDFFVGQVLEQAG